MIEITLKTYLEGVLSEPVVLEVPHPAPAKYVVLDKTGSSRENTIDTATFAIQSVAQTLYEAAELNERVKDAMEELPWAAASVFKAALNSDGNFTNTATKERRYQAVYHITYKE